MTLAIGVVNGVRGVGRIRALSFAIGEGLSCRRSMMMAGSVLPLGEHERRC